MLYLKAKWRIWREDSVHSIGNQCLFDIARVNRGINMKDGREDAKETTTRHCAPPLLHPRLPPTNRKFSSFHFCLSFSTSPVLLLSCINPVFRLSAIIFQIRLDNVQGTWSVHLGDTVLTFNRKSGIVQKWTLACHTEIKQHDKITIIYLWKIDVTLQEQVCQRNYIIL